MNGRLRSIALLVAMIAGCSDYSLEPMPGVPPDAEPDIEVYPGELAFGSVLAGEVALRELYLRNLGQAMLSVDPIAFEGSGAFTLLEDPGGITLMASEEITLTVAFTPDEPSALEGTLRVLSNDPDTPEIQVPLRGEGLVPWLEITPASHDFGELEVPCEEQLELVLQNVGNTDLEVSSLALEGDAQLRLAEAPGAPFTLLPGEVAYATVLLEAASPGEIASSLVTTSNDPREFVEATQQATVTWAGEATDRFDVPRDPPVDVLFAVDRSGSMDDDAVALGEAFSTFIATLSQETNGWNIGVLTYDHACFNHGILDGYTADAEALFSEAVAMGSDQEIVLDERLFQLVDRGLQQTVAGACNEGFLRPGAMLHVVVVSDEPERSTETASAWTWDYWLERWQPWVRGSSLLTVSGVVDLDDCNEGAAGYLEAIEATGGEALSICDADWAAHAVALAEASAAFLFSFELSATPQESSIEVSVDGSPVESGWTYDASTNTVVFDEELADSVPSEAEIVIHYGIAAECG
jgi:hypothetical protein